MDIYQYAVPAAERNGNEELYLIIAEHEKRASELLHIFWAADLSDTGWTGNDWSYHDATLNPQDALAILHAEKEGLFFWSNERGWQHLSPEDYENFE